jgi:hypothetical protein
MRWAPMIGLAAMMLGGALVPAVLAERDPNGRLDFHWGRRTEGELKLKIGENLSGDWEGELRSSIKDWEDSRVVELRTVNGTTNPKECKENPGQVEVCNDKYGENGWLGLTTIYYDTDDREHITGVRVRLNDSYFDDSDRYPQYKGKNGRKARRHTLCHELGHAFGLGHTNDNSCMNDSSNSVFDDLDPVNDDFRTLKDIYKHKDRKRDSTVSGNGRLIEGATGDDTGFFDIEQMPNATSFLGGRETWTVEELPDGRIAVTYTMWVE